MPGNIPHHLDVFKAILPHHTLAHKPPGMAMTGLEQLLIMSETDLNSSSSTGEEEISRHEIERVADRLNEWFYENLNHIPTHLDLKSFARRRYYPHFRAVKTNEIKGWTREELKQLYRLSRAQEFDGDGNPILPVELLVTDKSVDGHYLDARRLLNQTLDHLAERFVGGRLSPRMSWFWFNYTPLISEVESYVNGIRLRNDGSTPVPHNQSKVFETFNVPLEHGQQTAIGNSCLFCLEYAQPQGAVAHWRFSIRQHDEILVASQPLKTKPVYHKDELLVFIKNIDEQSVTLSVQTSG